MRPGGKGKLENTDKTKIGIKGETLTEKMNEEVCKRKIKEHMET